MDMTPSRPYIIRAFHEWITDNDMTPYILVDATIDETQVPEDYIKDGQITLNIAYHAVSNLQLENDYIEFSARFNGRSYPIILPIYSILGIFSKESGKGMLFTDDDAPPEPPEPPEEPKPKRPVLTIVK